MDQQGAPGGVGAGDAGDDVGAARGAFHQLRGEAGLGEAGHDPVGAGALVAGGVGRVEADQLRAEVDDLPLGLLGGRNGAGDGGAHGAPTVAVPEAAGVGSVVSSRAVVPYVLIQPARPRTQ